MKLQAKYREKPLQVIEVLPSDTYRVAELGSDGHETYATTTHVSQLKSWRVLREFDDEGKFNDRNHSSDESDDEVNDRSQSDDEPSSQNSPNDEAQSRVKSRQSARKRKLPARLDDYELGRP